MKEGEIKEIIKKFGRIIGPVAERLAYETAESLGILKKERAGKEMHKLISPSNNEEFRRFLDKLEEKYSKIVGKEVAKTIMELWNKETMILM